MKSNKIDKKTEYKYLPISIVFIVFMLLVLYGVLSIGSKILYKVFYKDMVIETIKEQMGDKRKNDSKNEMQSMQIRF